MPSTPTAQLYLYAAHAVADLVGAIDDDQWTQPGLGGWDVRALVGHTSRAMITVLTYLDQPAQSEDVPTPERYFTLIASQTTDPAAVAERGRQAGDALGPDPATAVRELLQRVTERLTSADPDALITTIVGGMRVAAYLPTRTFELVVHGLDIAAATGRAVTFSPPVLAHVTDLAGRIACELGHGSDLLRALTGRTALPAGFSVVG